MKTIEELRKSIDEIDEKLLRLLIDRAVLARDVGFVKDAAGRECFFDPKRERDILQRLGKLADGQLGQREVDRVFLQVISVCRQRQHSKKVCVFGEKNGWVEDAALARFGASMPLTSVDNVDDFQAQIDAENLGFACVTPQFCESQNVLAENLLSGKLAVVEQFEIQPEFSLVSNRASDLSEVQELCVTNEILKLLRGFFLSISFDLKIKICRSLSEVYENLQSINPVAAILPAKLLENRNDLYLIREGLKSEILGRTRFMVFAGKSNVEFCEDLYCNILCAVNGAETKLEEIIELFKKFDLNISYVQTLEFTDKAWQKVIGIEVKLPKEKDTFARFFVELEKKCAIVKNCGFYPKIG